MAGRKFRLALSAAFPRQLKVLVKPPGSPGTKGWATWHLSACRPHALCLHRTRGAAVDGQREVRAAAERQSSHEWDTVQNQTVTRKDSCWQQTATAKATHGLLRRLSQEELRNGEGAARQVTSARIRNPHTVRVGLWDVLPSHTPSQLTAQLGEVKQVRKLKEQSGASTATHETIHLAPA